MKTKDIKPELVGKKVICLAIGEPRIGVVTEILEEHNPATGHLCSKGVLIKLDKSVFWGEHEYTEIYSTARISDDVGNLQHTELLEEMCINDSLLK